MVGVCLLMLRPDKKRIFNEPGLVRPVILKYAGDPGPQELSLGIE